VARQTRAYMYLAALQTATGRNFRDDRFYRLFTRVLMKYPLISTPIPSGINIAHRTHPPMAIFDACGISRNRLHESLRNTARRLHAS